MVSAPFIIECREGSCFHVMFCSRFSLLSLENRYNHLSQPAMVHAIVCLKYMLQYNTTFSTCNMGPTSPKERTQD